MNSTGPASENQIELEERTAATTANASVETLQPTVDANDPTEKDKGDVDVELAEKSDVERSEDAEVASGDGVEVSEYPDGGLRAWSVVAGGWMVSFSTWGFVNAFGIFQAYYSTNQLVDYSPSEISWIGSVQLSMILASGIVVGRAFDRGHLRILMIVGTTIYFVSLIGLSFATTYAQIFVAQGLGCGVSPSSLFPLFSMTSKIQADDFYSLQIHPFYPQYRKSLITSLSLLIARSGVSLAKSLPPNSSSNATQIASGFMFLPAVSVVSHYFSRRRGIALGILATGSSVGGVVYPLLLNNLISSGVGFAWGVRAGKRFRQLIDVAAGVVVTILLPLAVVSNSNPFIDVAGGVVVVFSPFVVAVASLVEIPVAVVSKLEISLTSLNPTAAFMTTTLLLIACVTMRTRLPPRKLGKIVDFGVFKDPAYSFFVFGNFLVVGGLYTPYFYVQTYAIRNGVPQSLAYYALSILNAASLFGRLIPNWAADRYGPLTVLFPNCLLSGLLIFVWIAAGRTEAGVVVFAVVYGFTSGAFVSMLPACIASMTVEMNQIGIRMAMSFAVVSVAALVGTPISGAIVTSQRGSFVGAAVYSGVLVVAGAVSMFVARLIMVRRVGSQWV